MNNLLNISSEKDLLNLFNNIQDKLIILYFTAKWCGPCKQIKPKYEEFARNHITSIFCIIDIDLYQDVSCKIVQLVSSVPTFDFYFMGNKIATVPGADVNALLQNINACERYVIQMLNVKTQQQIQTKSQNPNSNSNLNPNQIANSNDGYFNPYNNTFVPQNQNQNYPPNILAGTPINNNNTSQMMQPMVQPMAQPMAQPIAQPMMQPMAQPMMQPMVQPIMQTMPQPMVQPMPQPIINEQTLTPLIQKIVLQTLQSVQPQLPSQPQTSSSKPISNGQIIQLPDGQLLLVTADGKTVLLAPSVNPSVNVNANANLNSNQEQVKSTENINNANTSTN
jgi:thiol-disulfide isomerase/thioredoxin